MSDLYGMRIEIIILIGIVFWIMVGHLLCSCTTLSLTEGFEVQTIITPGTTKNSQENVIGELNNNVRNDNTEYAGTEKNTWFMNPSNWGFGNNAKITDDSKNMSLPEGKLGTTELNPGCCANNQDCDCMVVNQHTSLNKTGGKCSSYPEY